MKIEKLSMIGHIQDTPRVLQKAYDQRETYMHDFCQAFSTHDFRKLYFLGSGTSYHVAFVIRNIFTDLLDVEGICIPPMIFNYHENIYPGNRLSKDEICVIGFSQHGDSISTCEALKKAHEEGYYTIAVSEQLNSVLETFADAYCHLVCEEEEIGPETRGYTETIFQFYLLAIEVAKAKGILTPQQYRAMDRDAAVLASQCSVIVSESIDWYNKNRSEFLKMSKSSIAGYGYNYPTALEARLKLFETYGRPCTAYEMEEQMHGPMRAYDHYNYIFLIASEGKRELNRLK